MERVLRALTAAATAVCLLVQIVHVAPAVAAPAPPKPVSVELVDQRTGYSKTWDNGDGTRTFESYAEPVHYRNSESGIFDEIDSSLVETTTPHGRGYTNRANAFQLALPSREGTSPVGIRYQDVAVYMTPQGRPFELEVHGAPDEATGTPVPGDSHSRKYASAYTGADLVYTSVPRGLKETIVLNSYQRRDTFSFDMECPGLTPSIEPTGSIAFTRNSTGAVVFRMQPPYMEDSSRDEAGQPAHSDAVFYEIRAIGDRWRLDVVADKGWLADPARVYPVLIDPTTYFQGDAGCYDTYVYSSYPTTNYGAATTIRAGRISTSYGTNQAYVRPELSGLTGGSVSILKASLRLYCSDRTVTGSTRVNVGFAQSSWGEDTLTWNTKPTASYVAYCYTYEGDWAEWDVTGIVQNYVLGLSANNGFRVYAEDESGGTNTYCEFTARENSSANKPMVRVLYTSTPVATIVAPSLEVPVGNHTSDVHAHWRFDDAFDKTQTKVHVQLGTAPGTVVWDSGQVACTGRVLDLGTPSGGWQDGRYWIRMRVWGKTDEVGAEGLDAPSLWTAWQPFDRKAVTLGSDGAGYSPIRASDSVGAGLFVDLPSGHLLGTRTDFSGNSVGGPLSYSAYYDSSVRVDDGFGPGWKVGEPEIDWNGQIAPNASFEDVPTNGNNPPGWYYNYDLVTARAQGFTPHTGSWYLMLGQNPDNGFFNAYVSTHTDASGPRGYAVAPGERLSAAAWVMTYNLTPDTSQAEYGALMKLHFYDGSGNLLSSVVSSGYRPTSTTPNGWRLLGLEAVAPAGAYYVRLNIEARNLKGYTYWDDVSLKTHGFSFEDGDGTSRCFTQVGAGIYTRDPLEPSVRFNRVNALRGAVGVTSAGVAMTAATDGTLGTATYDYVTCGAYPTAYLQYELVHAELLSELDIYLWDGAEATPRTYSYRIAVSESGTDWSEVVPTVTGAWSWKRHTFAPQRVRYVRVYGLSNTANANFHICEIEAPVLKLADSAVAFNSSGNVIATADPSGNPTFYSPYLGGSLYRVSETPSGDTGRKLLLERQGTQVKSLSWKGIDSSSEESTTTGIVTFEQTASEYKLLRTNKGVTVPVLTYSYDATGRISGATDADGIGFTVTYESAALDAKVWKVTRQPGTEAETVTTYTYQTSQVTISTVATNGGDAAPARIVVYKPASLGYQVQSVTTVDPVEDDPVASVVYDEYGQPWKAVDPLGRYTRTERDGRGNVLVAAQCKADGTVLRETRADYSQDHVVRSFDAKGNEAGYSYDTAWRVLNTAQVTGSSISDGSTTTQRAYDAWGNAVVGGSPTSTAYSLLRNGTFEINPLILGNGWDGAKLGGVSWGAAGTEPYLGGHTLVLSDNSVAPYITSDAIPVSFGQTYALSAWMRGCGEVKVLEYNASGALVGETQALRYAGGSDASEAHRRVAATFKPSDSTATIRLRVQRAVTQSFSVDNIRFEMANASTLDSLTENESMERISAGVPQAWHKAVGAMPAVCEQSSATKVTGVYSARIGHTSSSSTASLYSDTLPVKADETYTVSASMKTVASKGGGYVFIHYYNSAWSYVGSTSVSGVVKNTTDWTRYVAESKVPPNAVYARVFLYHYAGGGDAYFDAVSVTPGGGVSTTAYDAATHTYAVSSNGPTDIATAAGYDARGRTIETSLTPRGGSEIAASKRVYDGLDRVESIATLPDSGYGIDASFTYSDAGRLESVTDPLERTATIAYDSAGRVTGVTSAEGIRTKTVYDGLGRVGATFAPAENATPTVVATEIEYDGLSRVASTEYHSPDGEPFATLTPTYDIASRVTGTGLSGEVTGTVATTYDDLDRPADVTATGPAGSFRTQVTYDVADLPTNITYTAFGQTVLTVANTYAKTNELVNKTAAGKTWSFSFAQGGALSTYWSDRTLKTRSLDVYGRLAAVRTGFKYPQDTYFDDLFESRVAYDSRDRVASTQMASARSPLAEYTDEYDYDLADRLIGWDRTGDV